MATPERDFQSILADLKSAQERQFRSDAARDKARLDALENSVREALELLRERFG